MSARRSRGDGRLYLRGRTYWVQYNVRGKMIRESAHTDKESVAAKLLRQRLGEVARGSLVGPVAEKVTLGEMQAALLADYRLKNNRSVATAEHFAKNLTAHFGEKCPRSTSRPTASRATPKPDRKMGLANASINRETACLRRMFNLMVKAGRLSRDHVPARPHLEEAPAREGFVEPGDFERLCAALPQYAQLPARFLYITGWRKSTARTLEWMRDTALQFDANGKITGGTVTLQAENSKNKRAVTLPLKGELLDVIRRALDARIPECSFVFHRDGAKLGDFRKSWAKARKAAGLDAVLVHDMRRSSARNLVRSGTPERVAMAMLGHKTRAMFDRYNITSASDIEAAMERVSEYVAKKVAEGPKVIPLPRRVA
jgi:integrase